MPVYWLLSARESLRAVLHGRPLGLAERLPQINGVLADVFAGQVVLVRDRYAGYRPFDGVAILLVEIQPADGAAPGRFPSPATYIVKVALDDARGLKREIDAWNAARPAHLRHDNVFVSLEAFPDAAAPAALVYGDAGAVLGQRNILSLEDAITHACRFGVPAPASVARLLRSLYERLNTHFYPHAHLEPAADAMRAAAPDLGAVLEQYDETRPAADDKRRRYRRELVALLAADDEQFADPLDVLAGMRRAGVGPAVLRGTAHGDVHGRNVQVAVVNDEVSQCAVFDYEHFGTRNLVAWDFIKLEVETAVRLLDRTGPRDLPGFAEACLRFWRHVAVRTRDHDRHARPALEADLELSDPAWRCLADLLVSVRVTAHETIGRNRGRAESWLNEYHFLTAWYASRAALHPNYEHRQTIAALVAAGVAARELMRTLPGGVELGPQRRLMAARRLARADDAAATDAGLARLLELAAEYPHVLAVREELALVQIKRQNFAAAEAILNDISERYDHTTAETPALLGSLWKRRAFADAAADRYALERALTWYRRALDRHPLKYYPRVNVASLLLVLGQAAEARREAEATVPLLEKAPERGFWWSATRGEVMMLLGQNPAAALRHYATAAAHADCQALDRQSMFEQLVMLRPHLEPDVRSHLSDEQLELTFSRPADVGG